MKGYDRPVSNDWESIQLARYPDESRKKKSHPWWWMECVRWYLLLKEKDTSVFSALKCIDFINNLVTVSLGLSCNLTVTVYSNPSNWLVFSTLERVQFDGGSQERGCHIIVKQFEASTENKKKCQKISQPVMLMTTWTPKTPFLEMILHKQFVSQGCCWVKCAEVSPSAGYLNILQFYRSI